MADDPAKTAEKQAQHVQQTDHAKDGGASKALTEVMQDYRTYASDKSHSADDIQKYWKGMTDALSKPDASGKAVLPDLAVAWGAQNADGKSASDLDNKYHYDFGYKPGGDSSQTNQYQFDKTFANQLENNGAPTDLFKQITDNQGGWHPFGIGKDNDHITTDEMNKYLDQQTKDNATAAQQQDTRNEQAPLYKGNPPLISVLDGSGDNGKNDGFVSKGDMQRFMDDYNRFTENGKLKAPDGSPYTAENAKYVKDIMDGKHEGMVGADNGGASNGFYASDLATAGGYKAPDSINNPSDYSGVVTDFNKHQPTDATNPATPPTDGTVQTDASGKVTSAGGRTFGYDATSGQLNSVTNPDGNTWHKDASGKWLDKDNHDTGVKDISVQEDPNVKNPPQGTVNMARGDNSGVTDQYRPDGSIYTVTHEQNGADVTATSGGQVTDIKYGDGKSTGHFEYGQDGKLSKFTINQNGTGDDTFTTADGGKTFSDGHGRQYSGVSVDGDGTLHLTKKNGQHMKFGTDGKASTDDNPPNPNQAPTDATAVAAAKAQLYKDSAQVANEGPYQSAAKILGDGAKQEDVLALAMAMKHAWQDAHGDPNHKNDSMKGLTVGYQFLNDQNIAAILKQVPALATKYPQLAQAGAAPPANPDAIPV